MSSDEKPPEFFDDSTIRVLLVNRDQIDDASYLCPFCSNKYKRRCYLFKHIGSRHSSHRDFINSMINEGNLFRCYIPGCPCAYGRRGDLKRHLEMNHSIRVVIPSHKKGQYR